ncbi:MAG: ABC transporter ATP-binding protein [Defluviitaleaceae bacterium]|nr:ABC transporter ATP-binding protein [Defluviitaleaceae bacterium]
MVQIENLTKAFDGYTALHRLNLNIKKGSIYGLVGVNGSGKTTAIKHLAGIYRQDSGNVCIGGMPVYDNANLKALVGYIPDDLYFFPQYNMKSLRKFYAGMYKNWNEKRYRHLLEIFKLDEKKNVGRFSKGMQKQAAFIFVMSAMPNVLLLDEPIDGLDPIVRKLVFQEIIEDVAEKQMTVLVSSHNLKEMDGICDSIGIIKNGQMIIERDLDELKSDVHKIQVAFRPGLEPKDGLGFEVLHEEDRGSIKLMVVYGKEDEVSQRIKSFNPLIFDRLPLTLEEIFIYETEGANEIPY